MQFLTRREVAGILRRKKGTLDTWAMRGEGPPAKFINGKPLYDPVALEKWIEAQSAKDARSKARARRRKG